MAWLMYGAVAFLVYKMVEGGKLPTSTESTGKKPKKRKKKKKKRRTGPASSPEAPHEVLGVEADASPDEVRQAYQELMRKYHPDRVANAADELQHLAEQRSKEINAAFAALTKASQRPSD